MENYRRSDFFERQENARRATRRLVFWFAFGVAGTAAAIFVAVRFAMNLADAGNVTRTFFPSLGIPCDSLWADPLLALFIFAGTLLFIGCISLYKSIEFSAASGGDVAREFGGRLVCPSSRELDETRLLNVVQEMALASGVPAPEVFILENEKGINAFAAGTHTANAAVAVSRGALDKLSRDELQAVIGHEFSHILNGDMRLNMRLVGWIFGLVALSLIGNILFRAALFQPRSRSRDEKNLAGLLVFLGLVLCVIGIVSQIFAQIIQAAISRSRERLADASSAQFTRNPIALANALSRIGGDAAGSRISSAKAGEFAHLFFADGIGSIFATHPPLEERIRALDPDWDGRFLPPLSREENFREENFRRETADAGTRFFGKRNVAVAPLISELTRTPSDAEALICLMMMTDSPAHNVEQAKILLARERSSVFKKMEALWERTRNFPPEKRISAVLVAAPALRELSSRERGEFYETLRLLALADGSVSLYEFCILSAVRGLLFADARENIPTVEAAAEAELVLNLFLRRNDTPTERRSDDFAAALSRQSAFPQNLHVLDDDALTVPALEAAFEKLRATTLRTRKILLETAADLAASDGKTTDEESDMLRAFAVALNVPAPL